MQSFFYYFLIFFIYSIIGWFIESIFVSIIEKKIVNRGFLIGPYCPIYGYGSLGMILYLEQYKNNLVTVFILAVVICSILEYLTSYIMEKLFKARWWDYSEKKFNLNGRICGENALLFGLGGLIIIYIIHPLLNTLLNNLNPTTITIISAIFFLLFLTDTILSLNIMKRFRNTISNIELKKDSTQELKKLVKDEINESHKIFQNRLLFAFPNIELKTLNNLKKELRGFLKK